MLAAELTNALALPISAGSLNSWKPSADSASWRYVDRRRVKAYGLPPTVPRQATRPSFVRQVISLYDPGMVLSARVGDHALTCDSSSIARHWPRYRTRLLARLGVLPSTVHSGTA